MSLRGELHRVASLRRLGDLIDEVAEAVELGPEDTATLFSEVARKANGILELATTIAEIDEDEISLYSSIIGVWFELRYEWDRNNQLINFSAVQGRQVEPLVLARATSTARLVAWLEEVIEAADRERLAGAVERFKALADELAEARAEIGG